VSENGRVNFTAAIYEYFAIFYNLIKCLNRGVMRVIFNIRMKTGFFETKTYELWIGKDRLVLSSKESESDNIPIPDKNIISITLKNEKAPEIEIQTRNKIYQGTLLERDDFEKLVGFLKENLNVKIICEYEGGKEHE